jgi:hypothetical protein
MTNKNHEKIEPTANQMDCNLASPFDFEVTRNDESSCGVPFHGQCGRAKREYDRLLAGGEELANASDFSEEREERPDVNQAGKPKTKGIEGAEGV